MVVIQALGFSVIGQVIIKAYRTSQPNCSESGTDVVLCNYQAFHSDCSAQNAADNAVADNTEKRAFKYDFETIETLLIKYVVDKCSIEDLVRQFYALDIDVRQGGNCDSKTFVSVLSNAFRGVGLTEEQLSSVASKYAVVNTQMVCFARFVSTIKQKVAQRSWDGKTSAGLSTEDVSSVTNAEAQYCVVNLLKPFRFHL